MQTYNHGGSLTTEVFWKSGVLSALIDAAIVFFVTYYAIVAGGRNAITDVYSMGKVRLESTLGLAASASSRNQTLESAALVHPSTLAVLFLSPTQPVHALWLLPPAAIPGASHINLGASLCLS